MAIAQVQANASANHLRNTGELAHSQLYPVGENIAAGYNDPFDGWYDEGEDPLRAGEISQRGPLSQHPRRRLSGDRIRREPIREPLLPPNSTARRSRASTTAIL